MNIAYKTKLEKAVVFSPLEHAIIAKVKLSKESLKKGSFIEARKFFKEFKKEKKSEYAKV